MRSYSKFIVVATAIIASLLVATAAAQARRFLISQQSLRAEFPGVSFYAGGWEGGICPITLQGTLHSRTIVKSPGSLIGHITTAHLAEERCQGQPIKKLLNGFNGVPQTLPWHVRFDSWGGGFLPNIENVAIQIVGASMSVSIGFTPCLYRSTPEQPMYAILNLAPEGFVTSIVLEEETGIPLNSGAFCPPVGFVEGGGDLTKLGTREGVLIRLIA